VSIGVDPGLRTNMLHTLNTHLLPIKHCRCYCFVRNGVRISLFTNYLTKRCSRCRCMARGIWYCFQSKQNWLNATRAKPIHKTYCVNM